MITELRITSRETWMAQGLCTKCDPELFYPEGEDEEPRNSPAIRICNRCPVKGECLRWAYEVGDRHAILGGRTKNQRARVRNRMRRNS